MLIIVLFFCYTIIEVKEMRQKAYSIKEYLENNNYTNIDDLLIRSNDDFKERFGMNFQKR